MGPIPEFPRARHLEGSRRPSGTDERGAVSFAQLLHADLVVTEKLDGVGVAIAFGDDGRLELRAPAGPGVDVLQRWAEHHRDALHAVLGARHVLCGEWLYSKRTIFYDALPHWLVEIDVYDRDTEAFLSTPRRRELLAAAPVVSLPVLHTGRVRTIKAMHAMVRRSLFKTENWRAALRDAAGDDAELETDPLDDAEGVIVKVEDADRVVDRFQFVRASFGSAVLTGDARTPVCNRLADGVDPFGAAR